jgi:EmrB/QacA subfamily drug resistance transporter
MNATTPDPKRWWALAVLGVAYLMVVLDISIVNVALPSIQEDLGFQTEDLQWVVSGYALTFGGFLLLGGRMGDLLGRRIFFMIGLGLFAVTSLIAGFSQSSEMLIFARTAQGAAAAILSPSVFSIVTVTFAEGGERNKALGALGGIAGAGSAIGVLLGGILTEYAGWQWIFFVNVPIALITLFFVPRYVRESKAEGMARHFDVWGAVTVTASLILLVFGLTQANRVGWTSGQTIGVLASSAVLMAIFLWLENRSHAPLVPLSFFKRRTITGANLIGFGLGTSIFGMFFLLTLYMQYTLGYSALKTGLAYLVVALTAIAASGTAQALVTRVGVRPILATGMALLSLSLAYFSQISVGGSFVSDLLPGFIGLGIGLGFSFVPISIAALGGVSGPEAGLASGLINTSQQIGGALGVAILTTVATSHATSLLDSGEPQVVADTAGYAAAFWVASAFAAVGFVMTFVLLKRDDLHVEDLESAPVPG